MKKSEWAPGVYENFMETYDYTTCQRADGSYYGSRGRCIKGTEVQKKEDKSTEKSLRDKFNKGTVVGGGEYGEVSLTKDGGIIKKGRIGPMELEVQKELGEAGLAPKVHGNVWTAKDPGGNQPRMGMVEMDLAKGKPYMELEKTLSDKQKAKAADEYLRIQGAMHKRGIAHGDFHEQNYFFDTKTGKGTAIDFGLSEKSRGAVMQEAIGNQGLFGRGDWVQRTSSAKALAFNERRREVVADMEKRGHVGITGKVKANKMSEKEYKDYLERLYGDL